MAFSIASTHLNHPEGAPDEHASDADSDSDEADSPDGARNPKEVEAERLRVLEAAGLLVRDDAEGEGAEDEGTGRAEVGRRGTVRRRRQAPARPARRAPALPRTAEDEEGKGDVEGGVEAGEEEDRTAETEDVIDDAYDVSA